MAAADDDFHDFVVGFADPLARLAYVLTAGCADEPRTAAEGTPDDSARAEHAALTALAQTRRRWRDVRDTGAPEPLAVEALLSALAHRRHHAVRPAETATPAPPPESDGDIDVQLLRDAFWAAWRTLDARQRVPIVFADASVISPRLAGLDVPQSFGSARRQHLLASTALAQLQAELARDPQLSQRLRSLERASGVEAFDTILTETLHEHASEVASPVDPYPAVASSVRGARRRIAAAVAAVVALFAAGTFTAVNVSTSRDRTTTQAAAAASSLRPGAGAGAGAGEAGATAPSSPRPNHNIVVDWPTRGDARNDGTLLSNLRSTFIAAHPDTVGQVQILLATDTPWFRTAYVTAQSPTGIVQSWFYGPVKSDTLTEGASSYGGSLLHDTVLAAALSDRMGHTVLVVMGPPDPDTTDVQLADFDFSKPPGPGFQTVSHPDGIAIRDVSDSYVPALFLKVDEGDFKGWNGSVPLVQLTAVAALIESPPSASAAAAGPASTAQPHAPSSITVERGNPDPALLRIALFAEHQWVQTGSIGASGVPVVLWGGTDSSGDSGVVLRVKTLHLSDLVIVAWSRDPNATTAHRLAPDTPDFPFAFVYYGPDGGRVGVVAPPGVTTAGLVVDGVDVGEEPVDASGFASMLVGGQYGLLADQTLEVDLFDSSNHQVSRVPVTPYA